MSDDWHVYVLRCADDTLYTGITTDLDRRVREHNASSKGARYTRSRRPVELVAAWPREDRSAAASLEASFKSLTREEKLVRVEVGARPEELDAAADAYRDAFPLDAVSREDFRPVSPRESEDDALAHARRMLRAVDSALQRFKDRMPSLAPPTPEPLFFVGPGLVDGHVLEVGETTRVFFDLARSGDHPFGADGFEPAVRAAHAWMHAFHYRNRPEFYPDRSKSPLEEVRQRTVAEGLAVVGSEEITGCSVEASTWFGLLESDAFGRWRRRCEARRALVGESVFETTERVRLDAERRSELFRSTDERTESRLTCWYGRQIVAGALEDGTGLGELVEMAPAEWISRIESYFATGPRFE